jgi:hypothetical protein
MSLRRFGPAFLVLAIAAATGFGFTGPAPDQPEDLPPLAYFKAQKLIAQVRADMEKIERDIQANDRTIKKAEDIIVLARQKNNAPAETAAREALQKAREAKAKNEETRARLQESHRGAQAGLAAAREAMNAWVKEYRDLITERLAEPGKIFKPILDSLKDPKKSLPPPQKRFSDLQTGDVLLVAPPDGYWPGDLASKGLKFVDKLTSWEWGAGSSQASHTLMYLKTVNGQKLFLDDQLGEGPRIKTEEMVLKEYAGRSMDVAQPVAKPDGDKLWAAARQLEVQNLAHINQSLLGISTYNLYGDDHMVCSEASRWALIQARPDLDEDSQMRDTSSPFKKMLGVYFGPANFYTDRQHFIISGLDMPK